MFGLGHPSAKAIFTNWRGSKKGHQDSQDAAAHTTQVEAEKAGFVQPADEKSKGGSNSSLLPPNE